jgi:tRNA(Ile)-lysidine synthase
MDLSANVAACLQRHQLGQTTGVIAVSGGPDSVALAHLCVRLLRQGSVERLVFAHVNHQLRGDESDADETFVQNLPTLWQMENDARLTCRTQRIDVAAIATAEHDNLEGIARRERYRWFSQLASTEGAAWIATGHTADDQAETVLFRLLRGSGVLGLGAIPERRALADGVQLLRPLLSVRRQALLDYLRDGQIPYRVDSSNRELRFTRNRLRLDLLPRLQHDYNPAIVEVLCRLAEQAQELHTEIAVHAARLLADAELPRAGEILVFSAERLRSESANLVREMFRLVWQRESWPLGDMDFECWQRLVEIGAGSRSAWDFPGRVHGRRVGNILKLMRGAAPTQQPMRRSIP